MTQEGTNAYALNGDINYDIANDLNILASKDTYTMTSETETKNAGGSVGNNAVQVNYGQSESSSRIFSTTYNNVDIIANNINIKTGNNTDIKGANMLAQATTDNSNNTIGGNINMDIGNNLNIESLQDTYYAKSKSSNFGLNIGGGKTASGGNSASAGFNFGKTNSTTDSQWVNEQTSIIGNGSVNIKVGTKENSEGNINIKGAVIASGKYKEVELPESEWKVDINTGETIKTKIVFEDNGNLNLATNTLTYQDLNDFYKEETKGYNFGTSVGENTDKGKANMAPNGSTTIGLTHTGQEREQITKATIGLGNITIANNSDISNLKRDVNKSQEITKDIITGALNGSMTIDNRIFTSDGRSSIANDFKNLGSNLHTLYKDITKNNIIVQSVKNAVTDKDKNIIDAVKDYIGDSKKIDQIRKDEEITDNLNGMTNLDAERVRDTMQSVVDVASQDGGFNANVNIYEEYGSGDGYSYSDKNDPNNNTIGVNVRNTDIADSNKVINVLFHETTNQEQHNANERTATNRGNTAEAIWDMKNYANTNTNKMTGSQWLNNNINSPVIKQGNDNYLTNAMRYTFDNKDGSKTFNQKNQKDFVFNVSPKGKEFIKAEEGIVFRETDQKHLAYYDSEHLPTIGVGHLISDNELKNETYKNGLTENEMNTLFDKDLGKVKDLISLVATRQYSENQTDAVASAVFNLGPSFFIYGYDKSTENKGQYDMDYVKEALKTSPSKTPRIINNENSSEQTIQKQFEKYNYTGGKENNIIKKRRYNESVVYNKGNYDINKDKEKSMNYYGKRRLVYGEKK